MTAQNDLSPNLVLTFPRDRRFEIPPPSARIGMQVQKVVVAMTRKDDGDDSINIREVMARVGITDADDFDLNREMLGEDLYNRMLDELDIEEFAHVSATLTVWASTASKSLAEQYFANPTAPAPNRAARRKKSPAKKPATSK